MAFAKKVYLPALERETALSLHGDAVEDGFQRMDFHPALVPPPVGKTSLLTTIP